MIKLLTIISLVLLNIILIFGIIILIRKFNIFSPKTSTEDSNNIQADQFCIFHEDLEGTGVCLICEQVLCSSCLKSYESMSFCSDHLKTYIGTKWVSITNEKTTPDTPDKGHYIYEFKRSLWKDKNQAAFILTHYKINMEHDHIESYVMLHVPFEYESKMRAELNYFNQAKV